MPLSRVLQGARADEKPFADLSPREVDFSPEQQTMRLGNLPKAFAYFLNARNEFSLLMNGDKKQVLNTTLNIAEPNNYW